MKNSIIYIILLVWAIPVIGQDTLITEKDTIITNTGKIEVDQVEVIKAFEAKLDDAKKISVKPTAPKVTPVEKKYDYDITIVPIDLVYPDPVIKPLAMNPDAAKEVDHFYAKLGYGTLKSPYADLSYQAIRADEYDFIVSGHFYGADDSEKLRNRKFYESGLDINGGYRLGENNKLYLDLGGNYDERFLYDTTLQLTSPTDTLDFKRNILDIGATLGIHNIEQTDAGLNYDFHVNGGYLDLSERTSASETRFGVGGRIEKSFSSNFSLHLDSEAKFTDLEFASLDNPLQRMITVKPGMKINKGNISLKAAADLFFDNNGTHPFVESELALAFAERSMQAFVGTDQKIHDNSFATKYADNPFVSPLAQMQKNTVSMQYFAGIRGKVKDFLSFNLTAGYEDIQDQRYDRNSNGILMRQVFDDVTNVFVNANIEFKVSDMFTVGGIVNQNFFDTETLESPINISEYNYNAYTTVTLLNQKLKLRGDIDLGDKIYWQEFIPLDRTVEGNNQLDISLEVDFFITKNIAVWIRGNNLIDREYLNYHYYPGFGRNILGGLIVKF